MNSEQSEIELSPPLPVRAQPRLRPTHPLAVIGEVGSADEVRAIFLHVDAVEAIVASLGGVQRREEVGGLLLGAEGCDQTGPYLLITNALAAHGAESTTVSVTFTQQAWNEMLAEKQRCHPTESIVGWYHSHPALGVFLSPQDLFIHKHFFADAMHIALVVDPLDFTWGIFRWQGGNLVAARGCYVYGEAGEDYTGLAKLLGEYEAELKRAR